MSPIHSNSTKPALPFGCRSTPNSKALEGPKAALIAARFGAEFDETISEDPDRIAQTVKLSPESVALLKEVWEEHRADITFISWLAHFELSIREIEDIKERFGSEAYAILQADPYLIIREIPRFAFKRVDVIARKMGVPKNLPGRIKHGLIWCVREAAESGRYLHRAQRTAEKGNRPPGAGHQRRQTADRNASR